MPSFPLPMRHSMPILAVLGGFLLGSESVSAVQAPGGIPQVACPPQNAQVDRNSVFDYRQQQSTIKNAAGVSPQYEIQNNWRFHTGPAINRLNAGEFSRAVIDDLNFTFSHWPNHIVALQALIRYELGGGKQYEFPPTECYFQRAREFAPDDAAVYAVEGTYYFRKKKFDQARIALEQAIQLNPDSADVQYNLGLIYLELGMSEAALKQAHRAYALGYPLPGLKNRLKSARIWRDPPADPPVPQ